MWSHWRRVLELPLSMSDIRRSHHAWQRGTVAFTLIELVLVIVIVSLVAALAIPSFVNSMKGQRLDSAASEISTLCQQARFEALFSGHSCWYVIDFDHQTVQLLQEPSTDTNTVVTYESAAAETNILDSATAEVKGRASLPGGVKITSVQVQDGSQQNTGKVGFPFYNNGVCEPFRIFLQGENEEVRAMDVDMFTGKTRVFTPL